MALNNAACPVALLASGLPVAESSARHLLDLSVKHAMESWRVTGQSYLGMILTKRDADKSHGIAAIRTALSELPENAFHILYAQILANLAEAPGLSGQAEQGLEVLAPAFARSERTGEAWYLAELLRIKGELLSKRGAIRALPRITSIRRCTWPENRGRLRGSYGPL